MMKKMVDGSELCKVLGSNSIYHAHSLMSRKGQPRHFRDCLLKNWDWAGMANG